MTPDFHRIRRLPPYVLEEVNRIKARLRSEGVDIIDFGMGNPDMPTPKHIVEKMIETARDPKAGRYSASKGISGLRKAMAGYYKRRFGVTLNPDKEVIATLGSKEGFANLAQALTAPGDVIICPNPAYPIHAFGFIMAGGVIRHVPALTPEDYLSNISRAVKHSVPPPSVLILSLLLAVGLNAMKRSREVFTFIYFLPSVVPMVAAATSKRPLATDGIRAEKSWPVKVT